MKSARKIEAVTVGKCFCDLCGEKVYWRSSFDRPDAYWHYMVFTRTRGVWATGKHWITKELYRFRSSARWRPSPKKSGSK